MTEARVRRLRARVLYRVEPEARVRALQARVLYRKKPVEATARAGAIADASAPAEVSLINFGRASGTATTTARAAATTWSRPPLSDGSSDSEGYAGIVRWVLLDKRTGDTWTMYINPNEMTAPPALRTLNRVTPTRDSGGQIGTPYAVNRVMQFETSTTVQAWSWSGVILTEAHYNKLREWALRPGVIRVYDHLGRSFEVMIESYVPEEPAGRRLENWKMRYTMNVQFLRRVK